MIYLIIFLSISVAFLFFLVINYKTKNTLLKNELKSHLNLEEKFSSVFKSLSYETLKENSEMFLNMAKKEFSNKAENIDMTLKPIRESLEKFDKKVGEIEKERHGAYTTISDQIRKLVGSNEALAKEAINLKQETSNLVGAFKNPGVRGKWGENQLKRIAELSGMTEYCDFTVQESVKTSDGKNLRPDMIVRLPNDRFIIVDAKTPFDSYYKYVETNEKLHLSAHIKHIREHVKELKKKIYWDQFKESPEFVVMFLPDFSYLAALKEEPQLIEESFKDGVIMATPATLMSVLKAVAYGWRQENATKNTKEIANLGKELYERLETMTSHIESIGSNLESATKSYNKAIGSFESRVLSSAKKLQKLDIGAKKEITSPKQIETSTRKLQK
jgi:DNA recombination protein RmuC